MIRTEGRREGDSIVGANERRRAILEVLCQRKQDTMKNLANEFHVSLRTICYDIDELTRNYPIVTIRGKYKGGVKIADGYRLDRKYLNLEQRHLLSRPGCSVVKWTGGFVGRSRTRMSGGRGE